MIINPESTILMGTVDKNGHIAKYTLDAAMGVSFEFNLGLTPEEEEELIEQIIEAHAEWFPL